MLTLSFSYHQARVLPFDKEYDMKIALWRLQDFRKKIFFHCVSHFRHRIVNLGNIFRVFISLEYEFINVLVDFYRKLIS
jgi:hypothetical protein